MSKKFGDVIHISVLGQDTIVLGSLKAARDLLDKRSANYSDRPTSVMVQLVGYDWLTPLMNYGPRWRLHRRAVHPTLAPDVIPQYRAIQCDVARNFLRILLYHPQDLASHIKFTFAAVIMGVIYGIEVREPHDKYYQRVERMAEVAEAITVPGNFPVEAFPVLRYLPSWFPGGGFKKWAADAKRDILYTMDYLFDGARKAVTNDASKRSVVSRILEDSALAEEQVGDLEKMCKEVAATLYVSGADTVHATMAAFFVAMALYPEAQKKAQQELDAVVGSERLPELSDRPSLPYINALVKELFRWHPATPIGAPHRVVADDEYNGYLIPGGASVFVNMWAILRDPEIYAQPDDFIPERFLDSAGNLDVDGRDPVDVMFGFGRR
ncbi:cytochrome P450 [Ganoderma leucocontextum]|nr:cytochrome P450 [Ganoderma leucocontextum]